MDVRGLVDFGKSLGLGGVAVAIALSPTTVSALQPAESPILQSSRARSGMGQETVNGFGNTATPTANRLQPSQAPDQIGQAAPELRRPSQPLLPLPPRPDLQPLPTTVPEKPAPPDLQPQPPRKPMDAIPANPEQTVLVQKVEVVGSTVFSSAELAKVVQPFENQQLTFEQLLEIRTAITQLYVQRGYTTSGAFLPPQNISSGTIRVQVIEGELEQIEVNGLRRLRDGYVRSRLALAGQQPVNIRQLESALQLLQLNPLFQSVQAELKAGTSPGRSVLIVNLQESPSLQGSLLINNQESPSVGEIQGGAQLTELNLSGLGDRLTAYVDVTKGQLEYDFQYEIPLNPRDGTLRLEYNRINSEIIQEPFSVLGIRSESPTYSIGFRQPIIRTPATEFALSLNFDVRSSQTYLLEDIPFSFSLGPQDGLSKVSAFRFGQEWIHRTPRQVLAARSVFSFGTRLFGATENEGSIPDGQFFSWVGQFQWVQSLGDVISIVRLSTQLTPDPLLPIEQFGIGGVDTVRGYLLNQRIGDSGVAASLEFRIPIVQQPQGIGVIQLAPFFDAGAVWNANGQVLPPSSLFSLGLGLRWQRDPWLSASLYWGIPLTSVDRGSDSLQSSGIYFSVQFQPF